MTHASYVQIQTSEEDAGFRQRGHAPDADPESPNLTQRSSGVSPSEEHLSSTVDVNHNIRDDVDVCLVSSSTTSIKDRIRSMIEPALHDTSRKASTIGVSSTARVYNKWIQSRRLFRLATGEWLITAGLCGVYAGILSTFARQLSLDYDDQVLFNVLVTATTFFLGVNLAASLRSYAKLLRWLLLAQQYWRLELFDLILSCDSLFNVIKLTIKAKNARSRYWYLPSYTQSACLVWLLVNMLMPLFVGLIGLTYNMNSPPAYEKTKEGDVKFIDLSSLQTNDLNANLNAIQTWGVKGFNAVPVYHLLHNQTREYLYEFDTMANGTTEHWFNSYDPSNNATSAISFHRIQSNATCEQRDVIYGQYGNDSSFGINESGVLQDIPFFMGDRPGSGGLAVWSCVNTTCSKRCVDERSSCIDIFLAASTPYNTSATSNARFYHCTNTISTVKESSKGGYIEASDDFQFPDAVAHMLAGALGWSGESFPMPNLPNGSVWKFKAYKTSSIIGRQIGQAYPGRALAEAEMADFVSSFSMRAIVALDDLKTGLRQFKVAHGKVPVASQVLTVNWPAATWLLAGIPTLQLIALVIVFCFASRAIIKDESPLSIARLYFTLLRNHDFDNRGCMLRGDEIIKEMDNPMVTYACVNLEDDRLGGQRLGHVDVFESRNTDDRGRPRAPVFTNKGEVVAENVVEEICTFRHRRPLETGEKRVVANHDFQHLILYDGRGTNELERWPEPVVRYRDFDADEWFG